MCFKIYREWLLLFSYSVGTVAHAARRTTVSAKLHTLFISLNSIYSPHTFRFTSSPSYIHITIPLVMNNIRLKTAFSHDTNIAVLWKTGLS